jgi:hypothetical protein
MDKVEKSSFDWDNFNVENNNSKGDQHSQMSEIFNRSKKLTSKQSVVRSIEDSRDIRDISIRGNEGYEENSFHFEKEDNKMIVKGDERYKRLQNML